MTKPIVIVVHGMGSHPAGNFKQQFIDATNKAMNRIKGFKTKKIENLVDIEEINYDGFFDEIRTKMANNQAQIADRLSSIGSIGGLDLGADLVLKLASVEANFGKDEYLYTHLLDVVFYATLLGGKVRVDVAKEIAGIIKANSNRPLHIVAHSLGTAVLHDTLALLYRKDFETANNIPDLDVVTHKISSIWMVSNVSRLVNAITRMTEPYNSTVKPTPQGCTNFLYNVRHQLDPFAWLARFDPPNDGTWIPSEFYDAAYRTVETSAIRKINTHDFSEYMENPKVAIPLLQHLVFAFPKPEEVETITREFHKDNIAGAFEAVKEALEDVDVTRPVTLKTLSVAARHFHSTFKDLQAQLDALTALQ